jgi:hypothetical protein
VGRLDQPLASAGRLGVHRELAAAMLDADAAAGDDHPHRLAVLVSLRHFARSGTMAWVNSSLTNGVYRCTSESL